MLKHTMKLAIAVECIRRRVANKPAGAGSVATIDVNTGVVTLDEMNSGTEKSLTAHSLP